MVPSCIAALRRDLQAVITPNEGQLVYSETIRSVAGKMMERFVAEFDAAHENRQPGDVFNDHRNGLVNKRVVGMSVHTMVACALDPRTKKMKGLPDALDRDNVWKEICRSCLNDEGAQNIVAAPQPAVAQPEDAPVWANMNFDDDETDM